jgi:hypothetical protein
MNFLDLEIYILGLLIVNSLLLLWFFSPLKTTLGKILFKKYLLPDEFDDLVSLKSPFLGQLFSCFICCSFWLSLIIGLIATLIFNFLWVYPFVTFFTYPGICFVFYKIYTKQ